MKSFYMSDRNFPGGTLNRFIISVTIVAIFFMLSFVTIEASHAAGSTATAELSAGDRNQITEMVGSFIQNGTVGLNASSLLFRQKSLQAYRHHPELYEKLRMAMGWVLAPVSYVFKYPKVSLFFFFLLTLFLAMLDEFLYRYKRYPSLSEESRSVTHALAANHYSFQTPEPEDIIDETYGNSEKSEYGPLEWNLVYTRSA